jgi:hypothetical protein
MSIFIEDGTGGGFKAGVTAEKQVLVEAENHSHEYHVSTLKGQLYQALSTTTSISASATTNLLYLCNNSPTLDLVVTDIVVDAVLAGTLPASSAYYDVGFGLTYTTGGTAVTPTNMNTKSGNISDVVCYGNAPTLGGSFVEFDKHYVKESGDEKGYEKRSGIILGQNKTMTIRLVTDTGNTGEAVARVTFMMVVPGA